MTKHEGGTRLWADACTVLKGEIGAGAWKRWIEPLRYKGEKAGAAQLAAPSDFTADWVNRHYIENILEALKEVGGSVSRVKVITVKDAEDGALPNAAELAATMVDNGLRSAPLDRRFTFDQFVVGRPNELAHAAARRVAEGEEVTFNPVFLHGGVGLGKTHLLHAITVGSTNSTPTARCCISAPNSSCTGSFRRSATDPRWTSRNSSGPSMC